MIVYVAGKYTGNVQENIDKAVQVAGELWRMGHAVICPHANSAHFEDLFPDISWNTYVDGDLQIISRVDAVVMLEGWQDSKGAVMEREYALDNHIIVYYAPDYPPKY